MPVDGVCVTAERERLPILREEAAKRNCTLVAIDPEAVSDTEMARFGWVTFKENVAIALLVAELLKVNRTAALEGMWAAQPDPGVLTVQTRVAGTKILKVANVFAANDPESTLMNIERLLEQRAISRPLHLVINCRPDRVERNQQMGALVAEIAPDRVVLIGAPTRSAHQAVPPRWRDRVVDLGGARSGDDLLRGIVGGVTGSASLVAIGNIHGQGEVLLEALQALPAQPADRNEEPARPGVSANTRGTPGPGEPAPRRAPVSRVRGTARDTRTRPSPAHPSRDRP
jgi:poly-gamma-glutamate synthase PgsB/CapB